MIKRYLLFQHAGYYPQGGFEDLVSAHDTFREAFEAETKIVSKDHWTTIIDLFSPEYGIYSECANYSHREEE
jgi:hypothetical protein